MRHARRGNRLCGSHPHAPARGELRRARELLPVLTHEHAQRLTGSNRALLAEDAPEIATLPLVTATENSSALRAPAHVEAGAGNAHRERSRNHTPSTLLGVHHVCVQTSALQSQGSPVGLDRDDTRPRRRLEAEQRAVGETQRHCVTVGCGHPGLDGAGLSARREYERTRPNMGEQPDSEQ